MNPLNIINLLPYQNAPKKPGNNLVNNNLNVNQPLSNDIEISFKSNQESTSMSFIDEYYYNNALKGFSVYSSSRQDLSIMREDVDLNINLSYDSVGIDKEQKGLKGKKLSFSFSLNLMEMNLVKESKMSITKKTRSADEIMRDLTAAVGKALSGKKGKSISIELDKEAMDALGGSEEFRKLLIALMITINLSKAMNKGQGGHEVIRISGKAGYHVQNEEKTSIDMKMININVNISIGPPDKDIKNDTDKEENNKLSVMV